jgi:chromosomal replication initiator protein
MRAPDIENKSLARLLAEMILSKYIPSQYKNIISIETVISQINETLVYYNKTHSLTVENIKTIILDHEKISLDKFKKHIQDQHMEWVQLRQIIMYFCRNLTKFTFDKIGKEVSGTSHDNCIHGVNHITDLICIDKMLKDKIFSIEQRIIKHSFTN